MTRALLTLGRMPKGLEVARGLAASGCEVTVADPHRTHIARHSNAVARSIRVTAPAGKTPGTFVEDLARIVRDHAIDLVVPVSEEAVHAARVIPHLPPGVRFFGPDFETARILHDKYRFNRMAAEIGLPVPETALLADAERARALAERVPTIVKPVHGSAGIGLHRVEPGGALPTATERPSLVQERLGGREISALAVVHEGRCAGIAVYRGTIMSDSVAIAFERIDGAQRVEDWIRTFAAATGYTGFLSFDFFEAEDGTPRAIECNARLTSGIHFLDPTATGAFLLAPDAETIIPHKARRRFQHVFPCLGVTEMALLRAVARRFGLGKPERDPRGEGGRQGSGGSEPNGVPGSEFRRNLDAFLTSADVTWSPQDIKPFLMMNFCAYPIIRQWMAGNMSLGEAAITDVEWREPEAG